MKKRLVGNHGNSLAILHFETPPKILIDVSRADYCRWLCRKNGLRGKRGEALWNWIELSLLGQRRCWGGHRDPERVGTHNLREYLVLAQSDVDLGVDRVFE